ncbi:MAG: SDR family oxidoreductase [Deltaproteobacteria bacterium]|nr:SDR family oxidoreductase [Deltaproteobacteria bacterium]
MRIVVTGGSGMLGHNLLRQAVLSHEVWGSYHTHRVDVQGCAMFAMDVTAEADSRDQLKAIRPHCVVHTAGLTDVDLCERSPQTARAINSEGTRITATIAEEMGAQLIYLSTDYVFDGEKGDYSERDAPSPVNHYGRSKLLGEELARQSCSRLLIIRTTMFGRKIPPRAGMMESLVEALRRGEAVARFADQYFSPLYTGQLSGLILRFIELGLTGLFHVGSSEKVSRFGFAEAVAQAFAPGKAKIHAVPFRQIEGSAMRPRDTSLVSKATEERLGVQLPTWRAGLAQLKRDWENLPEEGVSR